MPCSTGSHVPANSASKYQYMTYPASQPANLGMPRLSHLPHLPHLSCPALHCIAGVQTCRTVLRRTVLGWSPRLMVWGCPLAASCVRASSATFVTSVKCSLRSAIPLCHSFPNSSRAHPAPTSQRASQPASHSFTYTFQPSQSVDASVATIFRTAIHCMQIFFIISTRSASNGHETVRHIASVLCPVRTNVDELDAGADCMLIPLNSMVIARMRRGYTSGL